MSFPSCVIIFVFCVHWSSNCVCGEGERWYWESFSKTSWWKQRESWNACAVGIVLGGSAELCMLVLWNVCFKWLAPCRNRSLLASDSEALDQNTWEARSPQYLHFCSFLGHGKNHKDAASVRATHPIPAACGIYYFEVKIVSKGRDG